MFTIGIADRLWFEETLLGATLHFQSGEGPAAILFKVGISFDSLAACDHAIGSRECHWHIRDGSLRVEGDPEGLDLTFSATNDHDVHAEISLYGEELKVFRYAVNALAARRAALLN